MEGLQGIKKYFKLLKDPKNKVISQLIFVFCLGFSILLLSKLVFPDKISPKKNTIESQNLSRESTFDEGQSYKNMLEKQLSEILQKVEGVGEVNIMITLKSETQIEPAFNTIKNEKMTEEKDNGGGMRTITENQSNRQVILLRKSGDDEPLVLRKITPKINGVLVVAKGASSSKVVDKIIKATSTLLDVPIYKIKVLPQ